MVREGWAIAYRQYSLDYLGDETTARAVRTVMWAGRFVEPSKWRRGERLQSANQTTTAAHAKLRATSAGAESVFIMSLVRGIMGRRG